MHINKLSAELLVSIFSNIDDLSQKIELEKVCMQWRQIVPLNWKMTKTCPMPLNGQKTLRVVLNRCGEWLEELWLKNVAIDDKLVKQMAKQMKFLKHLKLCYCELDGLAVNSIADLFGPQLCSFILDETAYHPNMCGLIENKSSKLEHLTLNISHNYSVRTLPTKLPSNLKSFSLRTWDEFYADSLKLMCHVANNCKNLKILHLEIETLRPDIMKAVGYIKSLEYLHLAVNSIKNESVFKRAIHYELPYLKALHIGNCSEVSITAICQARPDLVHLNVFTEKVIKISDFLNSLTLRTTEHFHRYLPEEFVIQRNDSIQHLDIRFPSLIHPSSSKYIEKIFGQFPNLISLHCKMPPTHADLTSIFSSIENHLENRKKITIYFHGFRPYEHTLHYKYILPDDLPQFKAGWRPKLCSGKCENLVLKKLIKEAIDGGNDPSFLDEWWME